MNTAFARIAKRRCSRSGSRRYPGPSTVLPARRRWNKVCCSAPRAGRESGRPKKVGPTCLGLRCPEITLAYILSFNINARRVDSPLRYGRRLFLADGSGMAEGCTWMAGGGQRCGGQRVFPGAVQDLRQTIGGGQPGALLRRLLELLRGAPRKKV